MRLPAYPAYKKSGIQWMAEVPEHWTLKRIKHVFPPLQSGVSVNSENYPTENGCPGVLKTSCVYGNTFRPEENKRVVDSELDRVACPVSKNSLIISRMNTPELVGSCGYVDKDYPQLFLPDRLWIARFPSNSRTHAKHLWYLMISRGLKEMTAALATGTSGSMKNLAQDAFLCIEIPVPPPDEQLAIANFLDLQTAKIDALLSKKRELIDKLKEKRTALISRTVTRGLPPEAARAAGFDPHPPMKPSGIESITEIPSDWQVTRVWLERVSKNLEYQDGNHGELHPKAEDYVDDGIPFVMANHITAGGIDFSACNYITEDQADSLRIGFAKAGDVLLTHKGTIGRVGMVQENSFPYVMLTPQVTYYRFLRNLYNRYIYYFFQGAYWQDQMSLVSGLGTTRGYIGLLDQRYLVILFPSMDHQRAIAEFLDRETTKIDAMIAKVEAVIDRLQEYRFSLITSAVTGKIDVRGATA